MKGKVLALPSRSIAAKKNAFLSGRYKTPLKRTCSTSLQLEMSQNKSKKAFAHEKNLAARRPLMESTIMSTLLLMSTISNVIDSPIIPFCISATQYFRKCDWTSRTSAGR